MESLVYKFVCFHRQDLDGTVHQLLRIGPFVPHLELICKYRGLEVPLSMSTFLLAVVAACLVVLTDLNRTKLALLGRVTSLGQAAITLGCRGLANRHNAAPLVVL